MSLESKNPKNDKERAKKEKEEAKKAQKEKKAKEKEEKKRAKKEKEEAKKQKEKERKEQRRKEKEEKKNKGKQTAPPPHPEAADPHPHPGCKICQEPEEEGVLEFLRHSLENWRGLPSFHDLTEAAKSLLGMNVETKSHAHAVEEQPQDVSPEDQELLDHIAEHIDAHVRQFLDPKSPNYKTPPDSVPSHPAPPNRPPPDGPDAAGKQQKSGGNGSPVSHGLDGNRDWPMTITRGQIRRGPGSVSPPEFAITQPPSRGYSPLRAATSRCVSPWCEQLGFTTDDPRPVPQRAMSWSRRESVSEFTYLF